MEWEDNYEWCEELERAFCQLPKYHMKTLFGDFSAKLRRDYILKPKIWNER